jgi:selenocysteine lyase/cysteine desulfurase
MTIPPLFDPAEFRIPPGICHVCAGGETPFLLRHDAALRQYAIDKSNGSRGRVAQDATLEHARMLIARLWRVDLHNIGWVSSVAEGVSMVMESVDWRDGDNICVMESEYPSVVAPFLVREDAPYSVRFASPAGEAALIGCVDERTRVIAVSLVSYLNGARYDLAPLRRTADAVGAMLVVDFTQASGYLPIEASIADFAFCSSYKWMLGMTGIATAFWNRIRRPGWSPSTAGWFSLVSDKTDYRDGLEIKADALRFTRGNPSYAGLYVLASALEYLSSFDPLTVQLHVQSLTTDLLTRLHLLGIPSTTPPSSDHHGASICVANLRAKELVAALNEEGIYAWNGRGRVRFSFHGYNGTADVDRIADKLSVWRHRYALSS